MIGLEKHSRFAVRSSVAGPTRRTSSASHGARRNVIVHFIEEKKDQHGSAVKDGLKMLYADHKHFRGLFSKYEKAGGKAEKLDTVRELVKDVSAHASVEQRYLYPLIMSKLNREDLQDRNYLDEKLNQVLLDWIDNHTPLTDEEWEVYDDSVHKLKNLLHDHMVEEEKFVMRPLERMMSEEEKEELYNDMAWGKQHGPTHPHPDSPQRAMAAKIMHPIVGEVDKAVDRALGDESEEYGGEPGGQGGISGRRL